MSNIRSPDRRQLAQYVVYGPRNGQVDHERLLVYVDDVAYDVSAAQLYFVERLSKEPGVWRSSQALVRTPTNQSRVDKIIKGLPEAISKHIDSKRGIGYRWIDVV